MICISCEKVLSAGMIHAIVSNVCPYCGQPLMQEGKAEAVSGAMEALRRVLTKAELASVDVILSFLSAPSASEKLDAVMRNRDVLNFLYGVTISDIGLGVSGAADFPDAPRRAPKSPRLTGGGVKPVRRLDSATHPSAPLTPPGQLLSEADVLSLPPEFQEEARMARDESDVKAIIAKVAGL